MKKVNHLNISARQLQKNTMDKLLYNIEGVKKADDYKFKEAVEYFTKAIELDPEDSLSNFNRATVEMDIGDLKCARSDFRLSESFQLRVHTL